MTLPLAGPWPGSPPSAAGVPGIDFSVELAGFADYTLLIAKKDPGAPLVWIAFGLLLVTFALWFLVAR